MQWNGIGGNGRRIWVPHISPLRCGFSQLPGNLTSRPDPERSEEDWSDLRFRAREVNRDSR